MKRRDFLKSMTATAALSGMRHSTFLGHGDSEDEGHAGARVFAAASQPAVQPK